MSHRVARQKFDSVCAGLLVKQHAGAYGVPFDLVACDVIARKEMIDSCFVDALRVHNECRVASNSSHFPSRGIPL